MKNVYDEKDYEPEDNRNDQNGTNEQSADNDMNQNRSMEDHPMEDHPMEDHPMEDHPMEDHPTEDHPTETRPTEEPQPRTGSYSYTRENLTDSRTSFPTGQNRQPEAFERHDNPAFNGNESDNRNTESPYFKSQSYGVRQPDGSGEISYTPSQNGGRGEKQKKAKKKKTATFTRAGAAVLCCAMLCLSAAAGFAGAYAAQSVSGLSNGAGQISASNSSDDADDGAVVLYRAASPLAQGQGSSQNGSTAYSNVAAMVQNSVVEIVTESNNVSVWFQYVTSGAGSGVILSEDGYIITNNHVVTNESTGALADTITVRLRNGEEYSATVVGTDADSDVAVIKIEAEGLSPAITGNSDNLIVGEEVIAVGNPLGELGGTVTNGIISATDREIVVGDVSMNLIQTNAAVNPGNSGGGLFNMSGELIGLVNAKSSGTNVEGLGFAIPVNDALSVAEQLLEYGYVRGKVKIGVQFLDATEASFARYYGLRTAGIYVAELEEGFNDQTLQVGDRVIAVNGNEVTSTNDISMEVKKCSVGDVMKFQVYRNGKLIEVDVKVYEVVPDGVDAVDFDTDNEG